MPSEQQTNRTVQRSKGVRSPVDLQASAATHVVMAIADPCKVGRRDCSERESPLKQYKRHNLLIDPHVCLD